MLNLFDVIATRFPLLARWVLGLGTALALPPLSQVWLAVICLSVLVILEITQVSVSRWQNFKRGTAFGFGYFCFALHWIGFAFFVDAQNDLWMMPFAVGGLSFFMALFWGVGFAVHGVLVQRGFLPWLTLPCSLAFVELLRGVIFTGFPWAAPGLIADATPAVLQLASIVGMPGLTLLVLLWCSLPGVLLVRRGRSLMLPCLLLATLPMVWFWGAQRLSQNPMTDDGPVIRLVQPNIAQSDKWRSENAVKIFDDLLALSIAAPQGEALPQAIIWPESSLPFLLDESPTGLQQIGDVLQSGQSLLAGALRHEILPSTCVGCPGLYFTSILTIDDGGKVISHYDKWRLVPGGEYLPLQWILEPLGFRKVVSLPESFTPGPGPAVGTVPGVGQAVMLICYEAIFPHDLAPKTPRARWIVNVTNDGWFGNSVGPYQHLAQVRMRAVEQGLPVARSANTGISAVIDGYGRIVAQSQLNERRFVDAKLPASLEPTLFVRYGHAPAFLVFLALLAIAGLPLWTAQKSVKAL